MAAIVKSKDIRKLPASDYLTGFKIVRPSVNYRRNSHTFAYRLSETVFGSLLASYVVGFIGFVAVYIQQPKSFAIAPLNAPEVDNLFSKGGYQLSKLLSHFQLYELPSEPISKVADLKIYPDVVVILQYLAISALFSIFTALLYFNYHRSIMYLTSDQKTSAYDFLLSVLIGLVFGLAMIFPLSAMFFLGLLTFVALMRKLTLLRPYYLDLAVQKGLARGSPRPDHRWEDSKARRAGRRVVKNALKKNKHPTLKSWGIYAGWVVWTSIAVMMGGSIAILAGRFLYPVPDFGPYLLLGNFAITILAIVFLFLSLLWSNQKMSSTSDGGDAALDSALLRTLAELKRPQG